MTQIDWDKAPKEATHCTPARSKDTRPCFWRVVDGNAVEVWAMSDCYQHIRDHFTYSSSGCQAYQHHLSIARPIGWNGSDLPPVGTVCELAERVLLADDEDADWFEEGTQVEVGGHAFFETAVSSVCTICVVGESFTGTITAGSLRPIRTAAQLAAEERAGKCVEIANHLWASLSKVDYPAPPISQVSAMAESIYDAGYRKVEVKP